MLHDRNTVATGEEGEAMLSHEDNERLCRTGAGTPMGNLFRRFWLPAMLSSEAPAPDSPPRRLRILGEDLVGFRDSAGRIGIISAYCPHKLAQLFWGRNEECGLRCPYHGWKFDVDGNCVDLPNVENAQNVKRKMGVTAYPTREAGGVVWVYMGPTDRMPELPGLEWTGLPESQVKVHRWLQCTNWAQGMEGEIDTSHVSFLHRHHSPDFALPPELTSYGPPAPVDGAPEITLKETGYGFVYGARRKTMAEDEYFWRLTQWLAPMYSLIANHRYPRTGRAWVPVDDYNVMTFGYCFHAERDLSEIEMQKLEEGSFFPPRLRPGSWRLDDGYIIDAWLPMANAGNDFLIDRDIQKSGNYTGIYGTNEQDRAIQESLLSIPGVRQGGLVDRSRERLVASDVPVITARKILLKLARDLEAGIEPPQPGDSDLYKVRAIAALSQHDDFEAFLSAHRRDIELR